MTGNVALCGGQILGVKWQFLLISSGREGRIRERNRFPDCTSFHPFPYETFWTICIKSSTRLNCLNQGKLRGMKISWKKFELYENSLKWSLAPLTNYFLALTCFHLMLNENSVNNHKNVWLQRMVTSTGLCCLPLPSYAQTSSSHIYRSWRHKLIDSTMLTMAVAYFGQIPIARDSNFALVLVSPIFIWLTNWFMNKERMRLA